MAARGQHTYAEIKSQPDVWRAVLAGVAGEAARVREIEAEIDRLAAKLWGLTEAELQEIQESLAELG